MRREATALFAVMAASPVFLTAVCKLQDLLIDVQSGKGHDRPMAAGSVSAWFGQLAAARKDTDTMLIPADVATVREHVDQACGMSHPMSNMHSRLPEDPAPLSAKLHHRLIRCTIAGRCFHRCATLRAPLQ